MGSSLQLLATLTLLTVRSRQFISKYDSLRRVQLCSAGILVFLWKPGRCFHVSKQEENRPKRPNGVSSWTASQAQLWYYPNQSLKEQNFIMWSCELKIGGGSPLPPGMLDAPYPWCI